MQIPVLCIGNASKHEPFLIYLPGVFSLISAPVLFYTAAIVLLGLDVMDKQAWVLPQPV